MKNFLRSVILYDRRILREQSKRYHRDYRCRGHSSGGEPPRLSWNEMRVLLLFPTLVTSGLRCPEWGRGGGGVGGSSLFRFRNSDSKIK